MFIYIENEGLEKLEDVEIENCIFEHDAYQISHKFLEDMYEKLKVENTSLVVLKWLHQIRPKPI